MLRPDDIQAIRVSFATTKSIRDRSFGAVTAAATTDAQTGDPVPGGLFCPAIFGEPEAEGCVCGKLSGPDTVGQVCPDCGATSGRAVAYRRRGGHIDLATPALHPWLLYQEPHPVARLLGLTPEEVVAVAHYETGLLVDGGERGGAPRVTIDAAPGTLTGPAGIRQALSQVGLEVLAAGEDDESRLLLRSLRQSGIEPADLVLEAVPIMPAGLRPRSLMQDGVAVTVEANDLYLTVLQRNRRLAGGIADGLPEALRRDLARSLQEAVEALLDGGGDRRRAPAGSPSDRESFRSVEEATAALLDGDHRSRSLATLLRGKEGIFRQNLLGKRLDYSGRSVIIPAPDLSLEEVGLPLEMALELFRPHVMGALLRTKQAPTLMAARQLVTEQSPVAVAALLEVSADHPILLNRAPTLHRLGLQAFYPRIIAGNAIALHPLTCCAFNADFDGDQMAVHVPLTPEAIEEARTRLLGPLNIFSPGTGEPLAGPTQDMVAGWAYATANPHPQAEVVQVASMEEARDRALTGTVELNAPIDVPCAGETIHTTAGRAILNALLPESLRFVNEPVDKRLLTDLVRRCRDVEGTGATIQLVNELHRVGFCLVTQSGLSVSWADYPQVPCTAAIARQAREDESKADTDEDRRAAWVSAMEKLQQDVEQAFAADSEGRNPVHLMVSSGARGNWHTLRRSAGMLGPLAPVGYSDEALEVVDRGYIEGLSPLQREAQVKAVRWSLATTMYRSTTCGVLGRRLVNACVDIIVSAADCGTGRGIEVSAEMARGRLLAQDVTGPDGRLLASAGTVADETLVRAGIGSVFVRSPLTCETMGGVCAACWGISPETGREIDRGTAVGVAAAQAVMEAAAQLTFRTFFGPAGRPPHSAAPFGLLRLVALTEGEGLGIGADGESWVPTDEALQELGEEAFGPALATDVRRVFAQQGVALDPRHFEVIARALLSRVRVIDPGDSDLLTNETIARDCARALAEALRAQGKRPPGVATTVTSAAQLGQTDDSFLAAAGYGNPAQVLTRAALRAAEDDLSGIRERLIVGKLIPVGTGWTAEMPGANGDS